MPRDTCADNNGSRVETDRDDEAIRCVMLFVRVCRGPTRIEIEIGPRGPRLEVADGGCW